MPISLDESQAETQPAITIPAKSFPLAWVQSIIIQWPFATSGSAIVEMVPLSGDQSEVMLRKPDGTDAILRVEVTDMLAAMQRCPELAAAMPPLIRAVHAWNAIVVADEKQRLENAEKPV